MSNFFINHQGKVIKEDKLVYKIVKNLCKLK